MTRIDKIHKDKVDVTHILNRLYPWEEILIVIKVSYK